MVYNVIGLMSGSSLDGLDIVFTALDETRGQWKFDIVEAECIEYDQEMRDALCNAPNMPLADFLKLDTQYGRYLGEQINKFIDKHRLYHKVHFVASHGHTVFHDPASQTTKQIGDGASIAALTGLPVISDLRNMDIALGGQGAPIVPIGDKLLFGNFDYWLNIGGIANMTVKDGDKMIAFDICPANQPMNKLAQREGKDFDYEGEIAMTGEILPDVLKQLNNQDFYNLPAPKSLSNEYCMQLAAPVIDSDKAANDLLRTTVEWIVTQIAEAVKKYPTGKEEASLLSTGGGSLNNFLAEQLREKLAPLKVNVVVPYEQVANFKEALVMALIGTLRWREETNTFMQSTGASRDSIGGAIWMGHSYNGN
ncbi:MAG: anhydro-N-acetylmuramic acid kinase [Sphingobacteriales bacterium]|nr:MAG: anhydro-N-acetylmuramic acid kinase [Sphingobacteriales bacterium]